MNSDDRHPSVVPDEGARAGWTDADEIDDEAEAAEAGEAARARIKKAPNAFRTISEVADELHIPQHVLRFWETKFPQVKPLKRGGGRRYYRPDDIALLRRISDLLYIQGYTIKGVQRLLREGGGKLSDDIPPPSASERAEAAGEAHAGNGNLELPIPGLARPPESAGPDRAERRPDIGVPGHQPGPAAARPADPSAPAAAAEVIRLRALLRRTLAELEALRALLP
jgi:DNA-binding transcriptional MerR regulator